MGDRPDALIRTPDQRLRIFVSSTLRELAPERAAVRAAIERMRLAPVMFELGARPHPPRELYRAYLAQSDVFIGIYGDSYGWVAPEEEVSGLEDEYRLAPRDMPKLIYIRESDGREKRLEELIGRIRDDDTVAYLPFRDAAQLEEQVAADLATLLAERFEASRPVSAPDAAPAPRLPVPYSAIVGRDDELARVRRMLSDDDARVVTLLGPGGIGKSRLAIETAHGAADLFPDGVFFVPLEGVFEPGLLLPTIAYVLGVRDNGEAPLEERVGLALADRRVLIVLDNFEQLVTAAPLLVRLYDVAPGARFLVTSRVVLRVRGERVCDVGALAVPDATAPATRSRAERSPAVRLFVARARAAREDFALTDGNAADVAAVCTRLEGLPLAIELAAAKARTLTPEAIARRLQRSLPLLTAAGRDLPDRHRTMTAAIDWSVALLPEEQQRMLADLGVFAARFTLEAVEAIGRDRVWGDRAIDHLAALVDASLVSQQQIEGRPAFSLLAVMREYALDRLAATGEAAAMRAAHALYYRDLVGELAPGLRGADQASSVAQLGAELPNLRAAVRHLVHTDRLDDAGDVAWRLLIYWWIAGFFAEVRVWMLELLGKEQPISPHTRAVAWFFALWGEMWQRPSEEAVAGLGECLRLFAEAGDDDAAAMSLAARATARLQLPLPDLDTAEGELEDAVVRLRELGNGWAEAITEVSLGRLEWLRGRPDAALAHFERATAVAEAGRDLFTVCVAGDHLARLQISRGEVDAAEARDVRTLEASLRLRHDEGVAYALEGLCAVAAARGDGERAGTLCAVASAIRRRIGVFDVEPFTVHTPLLERARLRDADAVARGEARGATLSMAEAVAFALHREDAGVPPS
ncbi:ATP-binding protein [Microbacterium sp. NPDC091313]